MAPSSQIALAVLISAHAYHAFLSPIQDCDEVFNYWEPAHYLLHGYGLQTWELSPEYSIRSWLYIAIHALPVKFVSLLGVASTKRAEFMALRLLLAVVAAVSERQLYARIKRWIGDEAAMVYLMVCATSAGSFISSTSFLPNSFVMYCVTMALASFMDLSSRRGTADGITWLAVGTVLGWPFAGLLSVPFAVSGVLQDVWTGTSRHLSQLFRGFVQALLILGIEVAVDSYFAGHLHSVPFNITLYNVFPSEGQGPDIYGTEPWFFYLLNLTLNYNLTFLLALAALPLSLLNNSATGLPRIASTTLIAPFYLWLAALSLPPHKEERFMYPLYPCLALNASISYQILADMLLGQSRIKNKKSVNSLAVYIREVASGLPGWIRQISLYGLLAAAALLGIWRSLGLATAYNAPFEIYAALPIQSTQDVNVCVGKEWYRFPTSFYLPASAGFAPDSGNKHLKFIRSSFHGLLPGEFTEAASDSWLDLFPATSIVPRGMNNKNKEDPGKYTDIELCDYLVDSKLPSQPSNADEPDYIGAAKAGKGDWQVRACTPFLDASNTGSFGRIGWAPSSMRTWGEYCVLKRKK